MTSNAVNGETTIMKPHKHRRTTNMKLTAWNRIERQIAQSERARVRVRALIAVVKAINEAHRNLRRLKLPAAV
jgi:hypothetical protein